MQYNVAQLLKEPVGSFRTYEVNEPCITEEGDASWVKGAIRLMRTDKGIWVSAQLGVSVPGICGRCLKKLRHSLQLVIDEEYFPKVDIITGLSLSVPEEGDAFTIDEHHLLDLDEAARQYIIVSKPMKPLCKKDCLGLCPICGTDRNKDQCTCQEQPSDSRWAPLMELLRSDDK